MTATSRSFAASHVEDESSHRWLVRFQNVTHLLELSDHVSDSISSREETNEYKRRLSGIILEFISSKTGWPVSRLFLKSFQFPFVSVHVTSSLLGGKGGFGTLLKGQSKQAGAKRTTDFGACRDLQGRRLRHVNDEIKLRKWREMQQQKERGGEVDESGMWKTPSGLYNWHLMVPNWASDSLSNKATRKMQRQMEREVNRYKSEEETQKILRQEQERVYQQSVVHYAQEGLRSYKSEDDVKSAILQGLQHKKQNRTHKRKFASLEESKDVVGKEGSHEQALVTLSGECVVEQKERGVQIQCKSDFGTMALVLDRDLSSNQEKDSIYMEATLVTAGLAQVGWADLNEFRPNTETGDGVGDDHASFAYDGGRQLSFHNGSELPYGRNAAVWKPGDVIGIQYRPSTGEVSFSLNGSDLGITFTTTPRRFLVPAMSCNEHEILELHVQRDTMRYFPKACVAVGDLLLAATVDGQATDRDGEVNSVASAESALESSSTDARSNKRKSSEPAPSGEPIMEPVDLDSFVSAQSLEQLGMDRLKEALMVLGVKCGGSLQERAARLFSLQGLERKDYPVKVRAKHFKL